MRRFLTVSFIVLALAVSAAGVAPAAHAQDNPCDDGTGTNICNTTTPQPVDPKAAESATHTPTEEDKAAEASWGYSFGIGMIVKLFAWLVGVAALTLNYAMYYTVVGMGTYVNNLTAIDLVWHILRDIGNILLIFGFLAIGISIIIDSDWYGGGQKLLPKLLIVAVFANFSLFAAKAMIDVGNLFATQIYKQVNGGSLPELSGGVFGTASDLAHEHISTVIMNKIGLQTIYSNGEANAEIFKAGNTWLIGFMAIILFIITAFVMFALSFILISRFIVLILLIMVSPVGVVGLVVPGLQGWANKWWHTLFQQTIAAPILLLMLYIALRVITDGAFLTGFGVDKDSGGWIGWIRTATGTNNLGGLAGMMLSFLIAMGLLLAVVYFAKTLSAVGASQATKWAGRLSFGAAAFGMSVPVNSVARLARYGVQRSGRNNAFTRSVSRGARVLERSRMDIRSVPGVGTGLSAASAGEAAKPIEQGYFGRGRQAFDSIRKARLTSDQQFAVETVIPRLGAAVQTSLQTGDYRQISTILASMSDKDLETRSAQNALTNNPIAAALLPQARFEKLQQSETVSAATKAAIATARRSGDDPAHAQSRFNMTGVGGAAPFRFAVGHQFAGMTRGEAMISTMNTATRGRLGGNILTENTAPEGAPPVYVPRNAVLNRLDASDFEAIRRTGELAQGQKEAVGRYILNVINTPLPVGAPLAAVAHQNSLIAMRAAPAFATYYNIP